MTKKHKIGSLLLTSIHGSLLTSIFSLHWNNIMKVVEGLLSKAYGNHSIYWKDRWCRYTMNCLFEAISMRIYNLCYYTLELPLHIWNNSCVHQQQMLLKISKPIWNFHALTQYHVYWLSLFKHLKLPISIKTSVTIPQIAYMCMPAISQNSTS